MLRIGEFVELSSISIHMLRHYDKIGLLVPRYIDETSGYRYYDKEQLLQANQIIALKAMDFGLEDIKKIVLHSSETDMYEILQEKITHKYEELEQTKKQIMQMEALLTAKEQTEDYALKIVRKKMHAMWVASVSGKIDSYPQEGMLWGQLNAACEKNHITIAADAMSMAIYRGMDEESQKLHVEVQLSIDKQYSAEAPLSVYKIEEREIASAIFQGDYSQISKVNTTIAQWLEVNQLEISGQTFTIYHKSPGNCSNANEFITEICFPIKEKC